MLMTRFLDVMDKPGSSRYRPGFMAYSMDEEGDTSTLPSNNSRFNSVGIPSTSLKGNGTVCVTIPAWGGKQLE
jgi:hypothetical protein